MGEITIKKFEENIIELKEKSERLAPQYFWNVIKLRGNDAFSSNETVTVWKGETLKRCIHITYSQSYCVPILWFTFIRKDGNSLRLEEILEMISAEKRNAITANKLISISQNEHPFLGICFYQIHPCNTHTLMKEMNSKNYVISWLSILLSLLPVVDLPNELFENLQ